MGDVINLNRYRKLRNKGEAERLAKENRAKYGRTKAERLNDKQEAERREHDLVGKQLDLTEGEGEDGTPDAS